MAKRYWGTSGIIYTQWGHKRRSWSLPGQGSWGGDGAEEAPPLAFSRCLMHGSSPGWWWTSFLCPVLFCPLPQLLFSSLALTGFAISACLPHYITVPCPRGPYVTRVTSGFHPTSALPVWYNLSQLAGPSPQQACGGEGGRRRREEEEKECLTPAVGLDETRLAGRSSGGDSFCI